VLVNLWGVLGPRTDTIKQGGEIPQRSLAVDDGTAVLVAELGIESRRVGMRAAPVSHKRGARGGGWFPGTVEQWG